VRATAQVEAEAQLLLGDPRRPAVQRLLGDEGGDDHQDADQAYEPDHGLLQRREMHARSALLLGSGGAIPARCEKSAAQAAVSFAPSPLVRTSDTVDLITRTRVFSAISTSISASSRTFVTLPMMPPLVTTVSPRRTLATISLCIFTRCCWGR